ncbi:MAG: cation:proton antiporter [Luteolibacter sp.]|uniref:cation:proton antiporter n=1 Tax=Luteolibacter sp. TaxID=1962973 RepID=UPI003265B87C
MHHLDLILTLTGGLTAALVFGYLTLRIGLSPIVGYLFAGIVVSANTPGFVADEGLAKQMAEIGVILLMFGVGLHFHFKELLAVKRIAIPGALGQSVIATVASMLILRGFGWGWADGAVFGMAIAVASTVVLTRILADNHHLHTPTGHIAIGWLVVEDILTVFVLVLIPAIFSGGGESVGGAAIALALLWTTVKIGALVAFTFLVGGRVIPWILTLVARTHSRELFTLSVLVVALGIAIGAAKLFGVSMELGAFLAGMVVGRSEFSTRAATDALPMKDAFAVLFFVSVGMLFNFHSLLETPWLVLATIGIVMIVKPLSAVVITLLLRYPLGTALSVGAVLSQIGEFSFIVGTMGSQYGLISDQAFNALVATAIVSITFSPLLYRAMPVIERWVARRPALWNLLNRKPLTADENKSQSPPDHGRRAVIIGYGPVGKTVFRLLRDNGFSPSVVEMNLDTVQALRAKNISAFFGDASHPDTLKAAGIKKADNLILSSSSIPLGKEIIQENRRINPGIRVIARTAYLREAEELMEAGATAVFSGEGEVALSITEKILEAFGANREQIDRERDRFRRDFSNPDAQALEI